jgi:CRISPR-associated protein Csm4
LKLFLEVRDTLNESVLLDALGRSKNKCTRWLEHRTAHNTINRHTGTTPPAGGLYFVDEYWPAVDAGRDWDVYVRGDIGRELLEELFQRAGAFGYGRDASLGRGHFTAEVENAPPELFAHPGNRLMSLSHGTLTANMREARYKVHTHYGKVGPLLAVNQPPFKRPVTLLQPGATFAPADSGPFGELLGDVHPHLPFVRHHAWHLTLPYSEVD